MNSSIASRKKREQVTLVGVPSGDLFAEALDGNPLLLIFEVAEDLLDLVLGEGES